MFNLKKVCLKIVLFLFSVNFFAEDWIIAGEKFELKQSKYASESLVKASEVLPQLILEQLAVNQNRIIFEDEIFARKQNKLLEERFDLFLQLSREVKIRDSLVLSEISPKRLEKKILEQENKIKEIQKKIDANLFETDKNILEINDKKNKNQHYTKIDNNNFILKLFKKENRNEILEEKVNIYQNDISNLFFASDESKKLGYESYSFSKEVVDKKINCLLTGSISSYGDYIGVSIELFVYPGAKKIGGVTEIGMISDLVSLSKRILQKLSPVIMNGMPIELNFSIEDNNGVKLKNPLVTIDGIVYTDLKKAIILDSGIHTVTIEALGYETESVNYDFSGESKFLIKVMLNPNSNNFVKLRLKKNQLGVFYVNAINVSTMNSNDLYSNVNINGKNVLAFFENDLTKEGTFIMIPSEIIEKEKKYVVNAKTFNKADYIDTSRRRMYLAYSVLMCSLPFTFYSLGEFNSANIEYKQNHISYDEVKKLQIRSNVTQTISFIAAGWFCFELFRYLYSANSVLPTRAKLDKRFEKNIQIKSNESKEDVLKSDDVRLEDTSKKIENVEVGDSKN